MKIEIQIHRIATDDKTQIGCDRWNRSTPRFREKPLFQSGDTWKAQHLYATVSQDIEPIKEGDWCLYNKNHNSKNPVWELFQCGKIESEEMHPISRGKLLLWLRKIVVTTNEKLTVQIVEDMGTAKGYTNKSITPFEQSFIKEYCDKGGIDKAMVDYIVYHGIKTSVAEINAISGDDSMDWRGLGDLRDYKLKLNSNNTITIYPLVEKMYSRTEILALIESYRTFAWSRGLSIHLFKDEWIKDNL